MVQESFDHVNDWLSEVNRYASEGTSKLLIGIYSFFNGDEITILQVLSARIPNET